MFVGGNHLVALPVYEAYAAARGARTCVVCFDAHLDCYELESAKEPLNHGNFLNRVKKGRALSIVNVGSRDLVVSAEAAARVFDRVIPAAEIAARPLGETIADLARMLRAFDRVHVDIDVDVLDPGAMRAVGTPMPFGLAPLALLAILDGIFRDKVSGLTISEYSGAADIDGSGRHLVVWLLQHLLLKRT